MIQHVDLVWLETFPLDLNHPFMRRCGCKAPAKFKLCNRSNPKGEAYCCLVCGCAAIEDAFPAYRDKKQNNGLFPHLDQILGGPSSIGVLEDH